MMHESSGSLHASAILSPRVVIAPAREWRRRTPLLGAFAVHDAVLMGYALCLGLLSLVSPRGGVALAGWIVAPLALLVPACALARSGRAGAARRAGYRLVIASFVVYQYVVLREVLPRLRPDAVDGELTRIDVALFGVEPARWLERFNTRPVVEWFSFFYVSYFGLCLAYLITLVWFERRRSQTVVFAIGTALVYCLGQLGYVAVPAYGPIEFPSWFERPLDGGTMYGLMRMVVDSGGAMKDVFPSLHTAAPIWFALYASLRARSDRRWRVPMFVTWFFAANIVVSTLLLRWHYGIDVLAGLGLAATAAWLAPRLAAHEATHRRLSGQAAAMSFP